MARNDIEDADRLLNEAKRQQEQAEKQRAAEQARQAGKRGK